MILYILIYLLIIFLFYKNLSISLNITILTLFTILLLLKKNYETYESITQMQDIRKDILDYIKEKFLKKQNQKKVNVKYDSIKIHTSCPKVLGKYNFNATRCSDLNQIKLNNKLINRKAFTKIVNSVYDLE